MPGREKLHEYQRYAIDFIKTHPVTAVLLPCGYGKSCITLTAVDDLMYRDFEIGRVLVVAPIRVCQVWADEAKKWDHLKGLRLSIAVGTKTERLAALTADADIYVINRENLSWLIEGSGLPFAYDMVVLDELSSFKNGQSKRFRAFMKVRPKVTRVVGLTASPASNGLMDLFSEFRCLDMGKRLGRFIGRYREAFFRPDRRNGNIVYSYKPIPGAEDEIYRRIGDITISMRAVDHLKMPELLEVDREVTLDGEERKKYDAMARDLILSLPEGEVTASNAASLSAKLLQMSGGAVYTDDGGYTRIHDRKLDALEDIIEEMNGRPLLVAYWFRHERERIGERLQRMGVPFREVDTAEDIQAWNRGEVPVMLIHPASAGHGLNLQEGGDTICWFTLTWSLELAEQLVGRLWRQGQKARTVTVLRIVARGTIDERVAGALRDKDRTQSALIDAVRAEVGRNGKEEKT